MAAILELLLKSVKTYPECFLGEDAASEPQDNCEWKTIMLTLTQSEDLAFF